MEGLHSPPPISARVRPGSGDPGQGRVGASTLAGPYGRGTRPGVLGLPAGQNRGPPRSSHLQLLSFPGPSTLQAPSPRRLPSTPQLSSGPQVLAGRHRGLRGLWVLKGPVKEPLLAERASSPSAAGQHRHRLAVSSLMQVLGRKAGSTALCFLFELAMIWFSFIIWTSWSST